MDYREWPLTEVLDGLVKAVWTLDARRDASVRITQDAVPDGCIEIIRRLSGRSSWIRPQPELFVAGIIDEPAKLEMSGDARFIGIRLWPWAWNLLGGPPARDFIDDWRPLDPSSLSAGLVSDPTQSVAAIAESLAKTEIPPLAPQILRSRNVAELSIRSGLSYRQLQRWFESEIGIAPRRYLKLLRFQQAFSDVKKDDASLAAHADGHGYADQAHMARDFRTLAGQPASAVRTQPDGPFLESPRH